MDKRHNQRQQQLQQQQARQQLDLLQHQQQQQQQLQQQQQTQLQQMNSGPTPALRGQSMQNAYGPRMHSTTFSSASVSTGNQPSLGRAFPAANAQDRRDSGQFAGYAPGSRMSGHLQAMQPTDQSGTFSSPGYSVGVHSLLRTPSPGNSGVQTPPNTHFGTDDLTGRSSPMYYGQHPQQPSMAMSMNQSFLMNSSFDGSATTFTPQLHYTQQQYPSQSQTPLHYHQNHIHQPQLHQQLQQQQHYPNTPFQPHQQYSQHASIPQSKPHTQSPPEVAYGVPRHSSFSSTFSPAPVGHPSQSQRNSYQMPLSNAPRAGTPTNSISGISSISTSAMSTNGASSSGHSHSNSIQRPQAARKANVVSQSQSSTSHQHQLSSSMPRGMDFGFSQMSEQGYQSQGQPSVLEVPQGYFPIFNGTQWVMISFAAAASLGIPLPGVSMDQGSSVEGSRYSPSASPSVHVPLSRQGSSTSEYDVRRAASGSRRSSLPPGASRAGSPTNPRGTKSPSLSSPTTTGRHASNSIQDVHDLMELLQRYEYLNAWSRQGKSVTPSEAGSPVEAGSVPKKQEPFEKSLVLKEITEWIEDHREYLSEDRQGLMVPSHIDFGNVKPRSEPIHRTIRLENLGSQVVSLRVLNILPDTHHQLLCTTLYTIVTHPARGVEPMFGNIELVLNTGLNESSLVGRRITWNVTNNTEIDRDMDPYAKSYHPQSLHLLNTAKPRLIVTGEPVESVDFHAYLEATALPVSKRHNGKFSVDLPAVESLDVILPGQVSIDLTNTCYSSRFLPLLRVEQHLQTEEVSSYNLFLVQIKIHDPATNIFEIHVSGLSERCPLLLRGDMVVLRQVTNGQFSGIEYKTYIYGTSNRTNSIFVHLPIGATVSVESERWNVQFKFNNARIREMYRAVMGIQEFIRSPPVSYASITTAPRTPVVMYSSRSFMFPTLADTRPADKLPSVTLKFFDPKLNWEQKSAVQSIVSNDYGPVPYLISGPPGTGKTKTLVEAALQLLLDPESHVLITAPSASACDTIVRRLIGALLPKSLFRLNHPSRTYAEVPDVIMKYCYDGGNFFGIPPLDDLLQYRVVVCACADAGMLISAGASNQNIREYKARKGWPGGRAEDRSHWTHLLVDEAAQAIEPETDIPILCVLDDAVIPPQIVLCGDHQQLGPRTALPELQLSLLERLMTTVSIYRDHPSNRTFMNANQGSKAMAGNRTSKRMSRDFEALHGTIPCFTNLIQNYRSHPKILMMPSAMFYNDTLVPSADKDMVNSMIGYEGLPNPSCPVAFVGVNGLDTSHLSEAISWKNEEEAERLVSMILELVQPSGENGSIPPRALQSDIGVMAPYREQIRLIRHKLRAVQCSGVDVGSVEDYQGQEHRIMFISTTRSRVKYLDQDVRQGLGLVHFRKRLNVALTRAKAMLVVVGNPELLVLDEHWAQYLHFCIRNTAYIGSPLPESMLLIGPDGANGGEKASVISRLELNERVSEYVQHLDSRRWLGKSTNLENDSFMLTPSDDEEEEEDEEGEEGNEGDEGEDGEIEGDENERDEETCEHEGLDVVDGKHDQLIDEQDDQSHKRGRANGGSMNIMAEYREYQRSHGVENGHAYNNHTHTGNNNIDGHLVNGGNPNQSFTNGGSGTSSGLLSSADSRHIFDLEIDHEGSLEDDDDRRARERLALGTLDVDADSPDIERLSRQLKNLPLPRYESLPEETPPSVRRSRMMHKQQQRYDEQQQQQQFAEQQHQKALREQQRYMNQQQQLGFDTTEGMTVLNRNMEVIPDPDRVPLEDQFISLATSAINNRTHLDHHSQDRRQSDRGSMNGTTLGRALSSSSSRRMSASKFVLERSFDPADHTTDEFY